jgi:hypothetical protein
VQGKIHQAEEDLKKVEKLGGAPEADIKGGFNIFD